MDNRMEENEEKINGVIETQVNRLTREFSQMETTFDAFNERLRQQEEHAGKNLGFQIEKYKKEFETMEQRLVNIKSAILDYEADNKVFARADQMVQKVENSVEALNKMLEESKIESKHLDKFFVDVEQVKEIRKNLDKEIRMYQGKRDKLIDIEAEIRGLMEMSDVVLNKAQSLQENSSKIDIVNGRIEALVKSYSDLESRITELQEYEGVISKNLESVSKTDIIIKGIENKISTFQKNVDRSEKRVEKVVLNLQDVEEKTLILKTRENEILDVKEKFNEIDGLSSHMEKRIDQIYAMFQKVETLRQDIDDTDMRLQEMFHETDKKMKQFSDFIQAVDNNNPILKQIKGEMAIGKNINDNMVKTIRELSDKGWSSNEISQKLLLDENSVRLIINTMSL